MSKYHINKHGLPAICKATKGNCPLGGNEQHFKTKEEAQASMDKQNELSYGLVPDVSQEQSVKRINALEEKVEYQGVYVRTGNSMNMGILEDDYDNIDDEVTWLISYAKEMAKKVKSLESIL